MDRMVEKLALTSTGSTHGSTAAQSQQAPAACSCPSAERRPKRHVKPRMLPQHAHAWLGSTSKALPGTHLHPKCTWAAGRQTVCTDTACSGTGTPVEHQEGRCGAVIACRCLLGGTASACRSVAWLAVSGWVSRWLGQLVPGAAPQHTCSIARWWR